MAIRFISSRPALTGLMWGIVGGIILIFFTMATTNGFFVILPYFLIVSAAIVTNKYKTGSSFSDFFFTGLTCFTVMSMIFYVFIVNSPSNEISFSMFDHIWRILSMAGIGAVTSLIISFIAYANPAKGA